MRSRISLAAGSSIHRMCLRKTGSRASVDLRCFSGESRPGWLHTDYEKWLEGLAPHEPVSQYLLNRTGEDNADAHPRALPARASVKRQVMGREAVVAITNGKLDLGP